MKSVKLASYAKINLTLEVVAKRTDGWHEIDSVVQVIDISDELSVSRAGAGVIDVSADRPDVPSGADNTVYRACEAFFEFTGIRGGAVCRIKKNIPMQAGLGGGSGNAAVALAALDQLYETRLGAETLAQLGSKVGSDAALFAYGGTVRMRGRGEQITPLPDAPELSLVVIKPDVGVPTAWAYSKIDHTPHERRHSASDAAEHAVREGDVPRLVASLWNEFDELISRATPEIAQAKQLLRELGARRAMLCGSGSAVFGVFESPEAAENAGNAARKRFESVFVTRSLRRCFGAN